MSAPLVQLKKTMSSLAAFEHPDRVCHIELEVTVEEMATIDAQATLTSHFRC
jgi:hypothetical protein